MRFTTDGQWFIMRVTVINHAVVVQPSMRYPRLFDCIVYVSTRTAKEKIKKEKKKNETVEHLNN